MRGFLAAVALLLIAANAFAQGLSGQIVGGSGGVGTVTSVTCNGGLSGGTFTATGTCAVGSATISGAITASGTGGVLTATGPVNLAATALTQSAPNSSNGTTTNKLVIYDAGYTFRTALTSSLTNTVGICQSGCTTSGTATIAVGGTASCVFDGATTAGDFVIASTGTAGDCSDGGATVPTGVQVIGQVNSTNGGTGTYGVDMNPVGVASAAGSISISGVATGSGTKTIVLAGPVNLGTTALTQSIPNSASGTATNKLAIYATGYTFKTALTTSTTNVVGICQSGCTTTGNAVLAVGGTGSCVYDGATTAGDWVVASTSSAGECHDDGATIPTAVQVLGQANSTNGGGGTYGVDLNPVGVASASANCPLCALTNANNTFTGAQSFGEVLATVYGPTLTSNNYNAAATDCGKTLLLPTGTTPTLTLPNINPATGCIITAVQVTSAQYTPQAASGGTLTANVNSFTKTKGIGAMVTFILTTPSASAAVWAWSGDGA